MKYGFSETKDLIDFLISSVSCWAKVYDDGSVDMGDIPEFWEIFLKVGPVVANADQIPNEVRDLDAAELKELLDYVKENLDIDDEGAEKILNKVFVALHAVYEVYLLINPPEEDKDDDAE